jgi:hypothetical protein
MSHLQYVFQGGYKKNNITSVVLVNNTAKTLDLTPGDGKRWQLLSARMVNIDDVNRNLSAAHYAEAAATNMLSQWCINTAISQNNGMHFPNVSYSDKKELLGSVVPVIIEDTEMVRFTWNAGGVSAGGTDADGLICQVMEIVK